MEIKITIKFTQNMEIKAMERMLQIFNSIILELKELRSGNLLKISPRTHI